MTQQAATLDAIRERLLAAQIGYKSIDVFGVVRLNVHIKCVSRDTADKWARLLSSSFRGSKVTVTETAWRAATNKHTSLSPTMIRGYHVATIV